MPAADAVPSVFGTFTFPFVTFMPMTSPSDEMLNGMSFASFL